MVTSLRSKGAAGKAVRAGLALGGRISESIRNPSGSRRPIFNATLRAAAGWLFFRVALLTFQSRYARRSRLEKQPTDPASTHRR
jgi:hypothetical protein